MPPCAKRLAAGAVLLCGLLCGLEAATYAQDLRQNEPGKFDYYMLVLSWSPSFCAANAERSTRPDPQCAGRPFSFVVHGLWPQYDRGFPEYCQVPAPRLGRNIVAAMLDLMPSPNLIYHEWDRHGTCAGVGAAAYFDVIRKARAVVKIPPQYIDVKSPLTVAPGEVADAFVVANPGLSREGISVTCGGRRLDEVHVCMTRDFQFRDCPASAQRACRRDRLVMPPVR